MGSNSPCCLSFRRCTQSVTLNILSIKLPFKQNVSRIHPQPAAVKQRNLIYRNEMCREYMKTDDACVRKAPRTISSGFNRHTHTGSGDFHEKLIRRDQSRPRCNNSGSEILVFNDRINGPFGAEDLGRFQPGHNNAHAGNRL